MGVGQKLLLAGGIASSVLYVAMNLLGALVWPGYSLTDQTVSELAAIGAPSQPLWQALGLAWDALIVAFGVGVWRAADPGSVSGLRRSLRVSGALLVTLGLVSLGWLLTPGGAAMHQREVLAAGGGTLSDTLHLVSGAVGSLFCFLIIGFGSTAFGARFRRYSIVTALVMLVFGALAGSQAPSVAANQPTPWLGVTERIMFASFLLWFAALSAALLRAAVQQPRTDVGLPGRRTDAS